MPFHRFVQPAYFGAPSCPAAPAVVAFNGVNYNLFNVTSGGIGAGGSALMSDAKPSGVNTGTYAVAFGEDATSTNLNRGYRALVENTDTLDDWFHRDIATPVRTANAVAGAPVSSIVLPANTYVGGSGGYALDVLFSILNSDGEEILNGDNKVDVASITGAAIGDGFSAGAVTLNLSFSIPTGTTYYVVYGTRSNLATLPADALISVGVRASEEVAADVRRMIAYLKGEAATAWDANPTFNTWSLGAGGLNSLYRRSSSGQGYSANVDVTATTINTPGAGAEVVADGRALTSAMYTAYAGFSSSRRSTDPAQALFRAEDGVPVGGLGHIGFAAMMAGPDTTEAVLPSAGGFGSYRRMGAGTYSVVSESASATMSATAYTELVDVELGTALAGGPGDLLSAVRCGYDLLRVRLPATIGGSATLGDRDISLRIVARGATNVTCCGLDGFLPTQLKPLAGPITVTVLGWYSASMVNPNGAASVKYSLRPAQYNSNPAVKDGSTVFLSQRANTAAQLAYMTEPAVKVFGSKWQKALEWGDSHTSGTPVVNGALVDDGSIECKGLSSAGSISCTGLTSTGNVSAPGYQMSALYAVFGDTTVSGIRGDLVASMTGLIQGSRIRPLYTKVPRHMATWTANAAGNFYLEWDGNVAFTPGALNADRTSWGNPAQGAKYPQHVFVNVIRSGGASAAPVIYIRPPFRDCVVGEEISISILLTHSGSQDYSIVAAENVRVVSGVTYNTIVLPGDGDAQDPGTTLIIHPLAGFSYTRRIHHIVFRCVYSGLRADGTTRQVVWVMTRHTRNSSVGGGHDYLPNVTADPADIISSTASFGTLILNQGWY